MVDSSSTWVVDHDDRRMIGHAQQLLQTVRQSQDTGNHHHQEEEESLVVLGQAWELLWQAFTKHSQASGLLPTLVDYYQLRIQCLEQVPYTETTTMRNNNQQQQQANDWSRTVDLADSRMALATLWLDLGNASQATVQCQLLLQELQEYDSEQQQQQQQDPFVVQLRDRAASTLFKAKASICDWSTRTFDSQQLQKSVQRSIQGSVVSSVHPYEALMWPCLSIEDATKIATNYAHRAMGGGEPSDWVRSLDAPSQALVPTRTVDPTNVRQRYYEQRRPNQKIRIGYISPDFTSVHPLAFLMQDFFRFHDSNLFEVYLYSFGSNELQVSTEPELVKIRQAAHAIRIVNGHDAEQGSIHNGSLTSPVSAVRAIQEDQLDILVDLCGSVGTMQVSQVMAKRLVPIQIAYMGFLASSGAPYIDYMIGDDIVIPTPESSGGQESLRQYYTENIIFMPHNAFVNSHRFLKDHQRTFEPDMHNNNQQQMQMHPSVTRETYGLPKDAFVFCCHSRAEKIDPTTFRSWLRALWRASDSYLWLMRDGTRMQNNLLNFAKSEFGNEVASRIIFCDKAPRHEHLQRLHLADVFLDTPAYNAHTVGCDSLSAGVPMISLLRRKDDESNHNDDGEEVVATDKYGSRVGASLLAAIGLENDLVATTMSEYEDLMVQCASNQAWFTSVQEKLRDRRSTSPLFDTERWVGNYEAALMELVLNENARGMDLRVVDTS